MSAEELVEKWSKAQLSERAASQEHFIDLCHLLGQPTPAEADATGADYCFEKHVKVVGAASKGSKGDYGFVDVWKRGCFAWEYKGKGKHKSLDSAYAQLYQYRDDLDNPPLSIGRPRRLRGDRSGGRVGRRMGGSLVRHRRRPTPSRRPRPGGKESGN